MACSCKGKKTQAQGGTYVVKLAGGLEVKKMSKAAADAFAASHPGSKVVAK